MADDDEIDILGDFSFNSCFAQNNQGIPSCSNREDTVHPQWLLDSTETNWYDKKGRENNSKDGPSRKLLGNNSLQKYDNFVHTAWNKEERDLLNREMARYGRNIHKISQTIKTKTEEEIQALIEAEYGVNLEAPLLGLDKQIECEDIPVVIQEEIVTDETTVLSLVTTGTPTIDVPTKNTFRKKKYNIKSKHSLLKPNVLQQAELTAINPSEILYEDDLVIGSTECIGAEIDSADIVSENLGNYQKCKEKKIGNHRRKVPKKQRNKSKDIVKSPHRRIQKDYISSEASMTSPKMQIVLGSGQALPVSEGEQIIKIEKKKESDPDSDIEVDIDSDSEGDTIENKTKINSVKQKTVNEEPIAVPLGKFEPMPKRQKKIHLDGGGGCTIMHTAVGDLYQMRPEPRRDRAPRKQPIHLIQCRIYNADKPAPFEVRLHVSTLIAMDAHAHSSRAEVMGLVGGREAAGVGGAGRGVLLSAYRPARAAAAHTHCEMDPVSQAQAGASLRARGLRVAGWHHSHPHFAPAPSARDLASQRALQAALGRFLALVTAQHWPAGRSASQYRCFHVENVDDTSDPIGYQFSVKLEPDLTLDSIESFLKELQELLMEESQKNEFSVDMKNDVCPQAKMTYLEKCISSTSHHMRSAGYDDNDPVVIRLIQGIRDIFR